MLVVDVLVLTVCLCISSGLFLHLSHQVVLLVVGVLVQVVLTLQWFAADHVACPVPLLQQFAAQVCRMYRCKKQKQHFNTNPHCLWIKIYFFKRMDSLARYLKNQKCLSKYLSKLFCFRDFFS
jgi:hypothetical protein